MSQNSQLTSHLFTVRVWLEKLGEDSVELRFQVKHLLSGEGRVFREGEQLLQYFLTKLEEVAEPSEPT